MGVFDLLCALILGRELGHRLCYPSALEILLLERLLVHNAFMKGALGPCLVVENPWLLVRSNGINYVADLPEGVDWLGPGLWAIRSLDGQLSVEGARHFLRARAALDDQRVDVTPDVLVSRVDIEKIRDQSGNGFAEGCVVAVYQVLLGLPLIVHNIAKVEYQVLHDLTVEAEGEGSLVE